MNAPTLVWMVVAFAIVCMQRLAYTQVVPDMAVHCDDSQCFCTTRSNANEELLGTRSVPPTDADRSQLVCATIYVDFLLRIADGGVLGNSTFDRKRAAELAALLSDVLSRATDDPATRGYVQCAVERWYQLKPTALNGSCAIVCVSLPPPAPRCGTLLPQINSSFFAFGSFYPNETDRVRRLPIRARVLADASQPTAEFRFDTSKLLLRTTAQITTLSADVDEDLGPDVDPDPYPERPLETAEQSSAPTAPDPDFTQANAPDDPQPPTPRSPLSQPESILSDPRRALVHPGVLVALCAAILLLVSLSVLLVLFIFKRVRKRDRGSYVLDDAHRKAPLLGTAAQSHTHAYSHAQPHSTATRAYNGYPSPPAREFYA